MNRIKLIMAMALLLCLLPMPYGYYVLVRFAAMVVFAVMAYQHYLARNNVWMVTFGALALLFQPIVRISWDAKHGSLLMLSLQVSYFTCCGKKDPNRHEFMVGYNLARFKQAQASSYGGYATALEEIKGGKKTSHWIWYIFPQLKGLGRSSTSEYYGIEYREEAKAYLEDETLGKRLREISQALMGHANKISVYDIFGDLDAMKVKSCMTLFDMVAPNEVFASVLDAFFEGKRDRRTVGKIKDITSKSE